MPQGKVIAVQPLSIGGGSALQDATTLSATRSYPNSGSGGVEEEGNIVYIGAYKDKHKVYKPHKVEDVFWYEDLSGKLKEGDIVKFKRNPGKTRSIGGAKDVEILQDKVHLPGGVLSKVALLASLLLLVAVMNDTRR